MCFQARTSRLSSLSHILLLLCFLHHAAATQVEIFSDAGCQNQTNSWQGPNGYPNGRCTSLKREGNFTSFKIVNPDPGCAVTLYAKDKSQDICSGNAKVGAPSTCYDATWYYYSIDECFKPGASSAAASSSSTTTSASSSSTSQHTTLQTHTRATTSATSTPVSHDHGPNIGAIVGGTVGGVAAGAALAAIGIICCLRHRRKRREGLGDGRLRGGSAPPPYGPRVAEVAAKEAGSWDSQHAYEMGTEQAVELQTNYVHELPTSERGELGPKSPTATQGSGSPILGSDRKR